MIRPRQFFLFLIAALGLGLCGIALFLYFFDLNSYKTSLEDRIAEALSQPVHLGEARLTYTPGPTFSFSDLRIGTMDDANDSLQAKRILLKLELVPLFLGRLGFKEVVLDHPRLRYTVPPPLPAKGAGTSERPLFDVGVLKSVTVNSLSIDDGQLEIVDQRHTDKINRVMMQGMSLHLENIALGSTGTLAFTSELVHNDNRSTIYLSGTVSLPEAPKNWRDTTVTAALRLPAFTMDPSFFRSLAPDIPMDTTGRFSLQLKGTGSPAEGLRFQADLQGEDFSLSLPHLYSEPLPLKHLLLSGVWQVSGPDNRFDDLQLKWDDLTLGGKASLMRQEDTLRITGSLSSEKLPVTSLTRFVPKVGTQISTFSDQLREGTLQLVSSEFSITLPPASAPPNLDHVLLLFEGGRFQVTPDDILTDIAARMKLENDILDLEADGKLQGQPIQLNATMEVPQFKPGQLTLSAIATLQADYLQSKIPAPQRDKIHLEGTLPLDISMEGDRHDALIEVHADLGSLSVHGGSVFDLPQQTDNNVDLSLRLRPDQLEMLQGRIDLSPLHLIAKGEMQRDQDRAFRARVDISDLNLAELPQYLPWMDRLAPRGKTSLQLELAGNRQSAGLSGGEILLDNVGLHLTRAIADLHEITGKVQLYPSYAQGKNLFLKMGDSPMRVDVRLQRYDSFDLDVNVDGKAVYARDIIFPSETAILHDIAGRLHFDRGGMIFDPVSVRLEQGTLATVRGTIRWLGDPSVNLDIESPSANIDEVIALWHGESVFEKRGEEPPAGERKRVAVQILTKAAKGTLGNLNFTSAEGTIWVQEGLLGISPLTFHRGKGFYNGQVLVDSRQGKPALLRISGHLEDFDAEGIYKEMLEHRGLVTGTLRGDFYLEGRAGETFRQSSLGGFSLEINNGVLRQFKTLSKIFSLLNVSQIFSLRLPDMAKEGMPFDHLQASVALRQGVLSTEDSFIESNAMNLSAVGTFSLISDELDLILGIKPLRTVDKIVTNIPLAGWLLTGEEKALITAQFKISGTSKNPEVEAIPITSLSNTVLGIFKRTLSLPGKLITDIGTLGEELSK